jgi:EF hand
MTRRAACFAIASIAFAFFMVPVATTALAESSAIKMLDTDKDGTVDMNEANAAAGALFDKLERDKDGTLDAKELRGRLSARIENGRSRQ